MKSMLALGIGFVAALTTWPSAQSVSGDFQIAAVSARPDFVSGGDVLIRIRVAHEVSLDAPRVMLNGADITDVPTLFSSDHVMASQAWSRD